MRASGPTEAPGVPGASATSGMPVAPARWSSRDAGTSERAWLRAVPWGEFRRVDVEALARRYDRVVLVAAHPDDETLAVGAFLATLASEGLRVDVLLATDGEGSHSAATGLTPAVVREVRRREFDEALAALLGRALGHVQRLGLPDGRVAEHRVELEAALEGAVRAVSAREAPGVAAGVSNVAGDAARVLVIAPSQADGHIDHDTCGLIAREVGARAGAACVMYPLWWWHWGAPAGVDESWWDSCVLAVPDVAALERKRAAIAAYASQTGTFARPVAEPAMLDAGVLAHFERLVEMLFDPDGVLPRVGGGDESGDDDSSSVDAGSKRSVATAFDAMFADSDDPWGVETRWYERRRRALIEAMLPEEHLGRVLDLGCSTGALTQALAARADTGRADAVIGVDASEQALARARRRDLDNVEWRRAEIPGVFGALIDEGQSFDTVVLSEIGYFLDGATLLQTLAGIETVLRDGGVVVVANWLHPTRDIPLDGRHVDAQIALVWPVVARYEDQDVAIVVTRPAPDALDLTGTESAPAPTAKIVPLGENCPHSSSPAPDPHDGDTDAGGTP